MEKEIANPQNAVVFACDANYLPYTITAIERIRAVEPHATYEICICSDSLTEDDFPFEQLDIKLEKVDISDFGTLADDSHLPIATFTRLVTPNALVEKYDRILYCDGDTYLLNPGLQQLFDMDMKGYAVAAVPDHMMWYPRDAQRHEGYVTDLGLRGLSYLNSGVLLLDVKEYVKEEMLEKCIKFAHQHSDKLNLLDQSTLNGVLRGNWLQLSVRWNWQSRGIATSLINQYQPYTLHFNGPRPWHPNNKHWYRNFYPEYTALLAKNFEEIAAKNSEEPVRKYGHIRRLEDLIRFSKIRRAIAKLEETATE